MSRPTCGALLGLALLVSGCPGRGPAERPVRELDLLVAASLGEPLSRLVPAFEAAHPGVRVALSRGSSSALARQIEHGAPCDLFISAAPAPLERLLEAGLLERATRTVVARNALVVIAPADGPRPARLEDLPAYARVAVGQRGVPVGEYARQALGRAGLLARLEGRLAGYPDEPAVVTAVAEGGAPAGLVYASSLVVHPRRERVAQAFAVDATLHDPIEYPAAVGAASDARADALAFLAHLRSAEGRALLRAAGFLVDGER